MADLHIPLDRQLFVGIDPGKTGGLGIVDHEGQFVAAYRWDRREPRRMYEILATLAKGSTEDSLCQADNRLKEYQKEISEIPNDYPWFQYLEDDLLATKKCLTNIIKIAKNDLLFK